jgi:hypothetical protein
MSETKAHFIYARFTVHGRLSASGIIAEFKQGSRQLKNCVSRTMSEVAHRTVLPAENRILAILRVAQNLQLGTKLILSDTFAWRLTIIVAGDEGSFQTSGAANDFIEPRS